jgi:periplasmic divalent cation tolerance protein
LAIGVISWFGLTSFLYVLRFCGHSGKMLIVLTTAPNIEEAENLARKIVEAKFAACVQVLPGMKSFYFWEGKVRQEPECLLLIKTIEEKYAELQQFIIANHSYDTPEIVALSSTRVSEGYKGWLTEYLT